MAPATDHRIASATPVAGVVRVVVAVEAGGLLDVLAHPNQKTYPNQRVLVVASDGCACLVPFVEQADHFFLKTVMPSRKATRDYLGQGEQDAED